MAQDAHSHRGRRVRSGVRRPGEGVTRCRGDRVTGYVCGRLQLTDAARETAVPAAAFPTQVHEEVHTRDTRACDTLVSSTRADVVLKVPVEISASSRLAQIT